MDLPCHCSKYDGAHTVCCLRPKSFYAIWFLCHPLTSTENFTEIVPGEPLRRGLKARDVAKYSDFGPIEGYISETMQERR